MISKKIEKALNDQVNAEFFSAYLYLSMEAYFQSINLPGFANWMRCQTQEELFHGIKIYDFINERNGRVTLSPIKGPEVAWKSPLDAFKAALAHEQKVTAMINKLATLAQSENDHATAIFLQWFVTEQVEEEANAESVIQKLALVADSPGGLFMIDQELAARVFTMPAAQTG